MDDNGKRLNVPDEEHSDEEEVETREMKKQRTGAFVSPTRT